MLVTFKLSPKRLNDIHDLFHRSSPFFSLSERYGSPGAGFIGDRVEPLVKLTFSFLGAHDPRMIWTHPTAFPALLQYEASLILVIRHGSASLLVYRYPVQR